MERLLLDTHALLWWLGGDRKLSRAAHEAILDPETEILVSSVSVWETVSKHAAGKLDIADELVRDMELTVAGEGFLGLPLSLRHAQIAGALPGPHRDPFDRMLMAQAMADNLTLVSNERPFDYYGVKRLW